ncbi:peptidase [Listeria weihenstephanensis]|uniref:Peptidase n=1 Tax=Listeria weihenstephanensis TaxID=1006155 RepID=A0A1S7FXI0_9LIST|nr:peptidase [Listeria weihenstephanensis]AQY52112.1 peptidase [Listeria weihenstephanensis]
METNLLKQLVMASGTSGDEQEIREILYKELVDQADEITFDGLGSFIARKGSKGPKVAIIAHMDEVGFIVKHISDDGFISFDTVGSWWTQSMLNHRVEIRTETGKVAGIIGSIAPHALSEADKARPMEHDAMFIDIGADSAEMVAEMGVAIGDFVCPEPNFAELTPDRILGKALDNRAGCALVAELFKRCENEEITLYAVATVQEEVGLRGAQTSAEAIQPDIAIVIDTMVAGDTPGFDRIKFPLKLGSGAALALFDKRYIPHQKLKQDMIDTAKSIGEPMQFCTMKTGATDGGRYNVMGGGRPVVAFCLPTRYLHANSSMISRSDYDSLAALLDHFLAGYHSEKHEAICRYIG